MGRVAIVGGGISGLAAAWELARRARDGADVEAVVFEASGRLGGLVETVREGGFTVECGPDAWVTAKPWASELASELGLADELIPSNDAGRETHILLDGRLVAMPRGMQMMVPTDLAALDGSAIFSEAAKAAFHGEIGRAEELKLAIPAGDESVAAFVLRHFGAEVLEKIAAPLLSGVLGGDVQRLSVRAVMPVFVDLERHSGSLIAGFQAIAARKRPGAPQPAIFTTLRTGLGTLVDRMVAEIPARWLRMAAAVSGVSRTPSGWTVSGKEFAGRDFDAVFLATPVGATRALLEPLDVAAAELLPGHSSSAVLVAFGYAEASRVPVPRGFGFLVPPGSGDSLLLACTFADQKFESRVPEGGRLIRAYFGGPTAERLARCGNDEIAAIAQMELARVLGVKLPKPELTVVRRWPNSLPQYEVRHLERVAELEARVAELPGLEVLGNGLRGVGLPDLVRDGRAAGRRFAAG